MDRRNCPWPQVTSGRAFPQVSCGGQNLRAGQNAKHEHGRVMENQLIAFDLANEHYGVDIGAVESIIKLQPITAVPHAPGFVEGITNLRGMVLPVIDLCKRFGLSVEEVTKETRIVVVEMDSMQVGMVVDAVTEVLRVAKENIELQRRPWSPHHPARSEEGARSRGAGQPVNSEGAR
jgi:chemotaxis signal transduction protein